MMIERIKRWWNKRKMPTDAVVKIELAAFDESTDEIAIAITNNVSDECSLQIRKVREGL